MSSTEIESDGSTVYTDALESRHSTILNVHVVYVQDSSFIV